MRRVVPALTVAVYLALILNAARPTVDPDLWWHVAAGERMIDTGAITRSDPWSYTVPGARWLNHEWLVEIGMAALARVGGIPLLFLATSMLLALTYAVLHVRLLRDGAHPLVAVLLVCAAFSCSIPVWGARPQMVTLLFLAVWMLMIDRDVRGLGWLVFPIVMTLWSNLHGGYAVGLGLLGVSAVGFWLDGERSRATRMFGWLAVSIAAAAVHPFGWRQLTYPLQFLRESEWMNVIVEWGRPTSERPSFLLFEILLLGSIVVVAKGKERVSWRDLLVFLAVTHLALNHLRHVPIWGLVAVPIVAKWIRSRSEESAEPRKFVAVPVAIAVVVGLALARSLVLTDDAIAKNVVTTQPVAATAALLSFPGNPRVLTLYHWAGYVIWRSQGRVRVFIDPRADTIYPDGVLRDYRKVLSVDPEGRRILDQSRTDAVMLPTDSAIIRVLRGNGWRLAHQDPGATLLVR